MSHPISDGKEVKEMTASHLECAAESSFEDVPLTEMLRHPDCGIELTVLGLAPRFLDLASDYSDDKGG